MTRPQARLPPLVWGPLCIGLGCGILGLGFRVQSSGLWAAGLGFRGLVELSGEYVSEEKVLFWALLTWEVSSSTRISNIAYKPFRRLSHLLTSAWPPYPARLGRSSNPKPQAPKPLTSHPLNAKILSLPLALCPPRLF